MDFIGFSFGKTHLLRHLKVYRTSDGSRYNDNLVPAMTDKTADVPGGNGQYYFRTTYKNRTFNVNFAFDDLSESDIRKLRELFNGKEVQDLIFDEQPYKVYSAKVTGTPTLKTICFDDTDGKRVYRGEGSVTFTCYYPFAHTPDWVWTEDGWKEADGRLLSAYDTGAYAKQTTTRPNAEDPEHTEEIQWFQWNVGEVAVLTDDTDVNRGELDAPFVVEGAQGTVTVGDLTIIVPDGSVATWDSMTGLVKDANGKIIPQSGKTYGTIPAGEEAKIEGTGTLKFKYWYY